MIEAAAAVMTGHAGDRLPLIADSHMRLTGRPLVPPGGDIARTLWEAPAVILAHGTEPDPLFFYGNRAALDLFELTPEQLIGMPSRLSAEPIERAERARLFERVQRDGFIDDYAGVRISSVGRRFLIEQATVWTLLDAEHRRYGEAASFDRWKPLGRGSEAIDLPGR